MICKNRKRLHSLKTFVIMAENTEKPTYSLANLLGER